MSSDDKQAMENTTTSNEAPVEKNGLFSSIRGFWNKTPQENDTDTLSLFLPISKGQDSPISKEEVDRFIAKETGLGRLKHMYSYQPMSVISADLHNVLSLGAPMTLFSGMIIAGLRYPSAKFDFLKSPERGLVKFQRKNLRMARMYKYDILLLDLFRTAFKAGFKFGGFFTCILLVNQSLATYHNKSSPLYYAAGGAVAGALNKFVDGTRAMIAGGTVAGFIGLVYGGAFYLFLKQYGMTQDIFHWEDVRRRLEIGYELLEKENASKDDSKTKKDS